MSVIPSQQPVLHAQLSTYLGIAVYAVKVIHGAQDTSALIVIRN